MDELQTVRDNRMLFGESAFKSLIINVVLCGHFKIQKKTLVNSIYHKVENKAFPESLCVFAATSFKSAKCPNFLLRRKHKLPPHTLHIFEYVPLLFRTTRIYQKLIFGELTCVFVQLIVGCNQKSFNPLHLIAQIYIYVKSDRQKIVSMSKYQYRDTDVSISIDTKLFQSGRYLFHVFSLTATAHNRVNATL